MPKPPEIIDGSNGGHTRMWFTLARLHRVDGPAEEDFTFKYWAINGKPHRKDGPAKIWNLLDLRLSYVEWWVDGVLIRQNKYTMFNDERW